MAGSKRKRQLPAVVVGLLISVACVALIVVVFVIWSLLLIPTPKSIPLVCDEYTTADVDYLDSMLDPLFYFLQAVNRLTELESTDDRLNVYLDMGNRLIEVQALTPTPKSQSLHEDIVTMMGNHIAGDTQAALAAWIHIETELRHIMTCLSPPKGKLPTL